LAEEDGDRGHAPEVLETEGKYSVELFKEGGEGAGHEIVEDAYRCHCCFYVGSDGDPQR
jgi:hypothetical protein